MEVGDFGLAKSMNDDSLHLTMTGMAMGSPHYISPEQAEANRNVDFRSDIYSLGCTLFHMLSGKPPYAGDNAFP